MPDPHFAAESSDGSDSGEDEPRPLGVRRVFALLLGGLLGLVLGTLIADLRFGLIFGSVWLVSRGAFAVHEHYQWRRRMKNDADALSQG